MSAATSRAPDAFDRLSERLADRVNPIVVKEVRQGLRTRVFWIFFSLMLAACLVIALFAYAAADADKRGVGQATFLAYLVCLAVAQFFIIPYTAYRSMAREAEDETWVLLTLTGLGARRILAGKVASSVVQGALYSSAVMPFLLFSYFLHGVDLPTIVMGVLGSIGYQVFLVSSCVSIGSMAESRLMRALLHFVVLGMLLHAVGFGIAIAAALGKLATHSSTDFWPVFLAILFGLVTTGLLLFEAAAARLSLPTEDYARGVRLAYSAQFVGAALLFVWGSFIKTSMEMLAVGSVILSVYATLVGIFVASDRHGMAKAHWASGRRYALLRPGGLRGYLLVVGLLLAMWAVYGPLAVSAPNISEGSMMVLVAAPAFALMMLSLPVVVAHWIPHPPWQTPAILRSTFLGLMVLMCGIPPLVGEMTSRADNPILNALNPVMGLINIGRSPEDAPPLVLLVWAVGVGLACWAYSILRARDGEGLSVR